MPSAWVVADTLDAATAGAVDELLAAIEGTTGDEAFSEAGIDLLTEGATRHALRHEDGVLTGYGLLPLRLGADAEPALGCYDGGFARLVELDEVASSMLLRTVADGLVDALVSRGWSVARRVDRLGRTLPAPAPPATDLEVRTFVQGRDEAAWVAQNNAAFVGHPTQGTMSVDRVLALELAPWFDPAGFLLFFDGPKLAASCWTKVHRGTTRTVGEIYVVSVAPFAQGRGFGRVAVLCGLEHLASRGIELAELYVEEENATAYRLYESLGFACNARVVELRHDASRTRGVRS